MANSSQVDSRARLGILTLSGTVDVHDLLEAMSTLYDRPEWQPGFDVLWDASGITELILGPTDIRTIVEVVRSRAVQIGHGRTAIVVFRDLDASIARLLTRLLQSDRRDRRLFQEHAVALAWLREETSSRKAS